MYSQSSRDLWKQTGTRGAVRISDSWKSSIFPSKVTGSTTDTQLQPSFIRGASEVGFSRASSMEIHKADDMYVFGLLAWEVMNPSRTRIVHLLKSTQ